MLLLASGRRGDAGRSREQIAERESGLASTFLQCTYSFFMDIEYFQPVNAPPIRTAVDFPPFSLLYEHIVDTLILAMFSRSPCNEHKMKSFIKVESFIIFPQNR